MSEKEKEKLLARLDALGAKDWVRDAVAALSSGQVRFAGQVDPVATTSVSNLLRIYRVRRSHCVRVGIHASGLDDFLEALAKLDVDSSVLIRPFLGDGQSVTAFYSSSDELIGCITLPWVEGEEQNVRG